MRRYFLVLCVAAAFGSAPGSAAAKETVASHCESDGLAHCVEVIRSAGRISLTFPRLLNGLGTQLPQLPQLPPLRLPCPRGATRGHRMSEIQALEGVRWRFRES